MAQTVKESACSVGDPASIPGSGRSPGEGHGNPLQYSCLENPMDRGAWWATVHGVAKSQTRLRDLTHFYPVVTVKNPRLLGAGNGNLLQYSCLENPMDRGAWWATLHGDAKGWTQLKRISSSIELKCKNIKSKEKIQGSYFTNCPQMKHSH